MNHQNENLLKHVKANRSQAESEGYRLARATSNVLIKTLNEGFDEIADGVLMVYTVFNVYQTQEDISRYCEYISIIYYPPKREQVSTLDDYLFFEEGINIKKFFRDKNPSHQIDKGQLDLMNEIVAHVNKHMTGGDAMIPHLHKLVMDTQLEFGEFKPYTLPDITDFPETMKTQEVARSIMLALTEKLEAML